MIKHTRTHCVFHCTVQQQHVPQQQHAYGVAVDAGSVEVAEFLRGCSDQYDVESETGFFKSLGASVANAKQSME